VLNSVTAFLDEHIALGAADRPAIVTPSGATTYGKLLARVNRTGNALRSLGVEPEQRVAMLLPDGVPWAATFFGALRIGAVAVPLNTRLRPADWVAMIRDSSAKVLVADADLFAQLRSSLTDVPRLKAVVVTGRAGYRSLDEMLATAPAELTPEPVAGDDMAFWLYTSGTTGGPKAAIHVHSDLMACRHYGIDVLGASETDRAFATSKLFFAYALGNALLIPLFVGARTCLRPEWPEPQLVADAVADFAPTLFFSVPTFYARMLEAGLDPQTFRSVRTFVSAGERLPVEIFGRWKERFGVEIVEGLGATETIFMVLSNRPGRCRPGSAGTPVPGTDAKLLDSAGQEVTAGTPGMLHVRTPSASAAYWNRIDASRRAFAAGWFRTGDIFTRDADGFYQHVGREDDLFKVAGMWVAPADIEAVLLSHPAVADAGVVGAEDAAGLVKPVAFVTARKTRAREHDGLVDDLKALVSEKLPAHQRPRRIVVVDELPRTPNGKLQRFLLKERVPAP
jgi:benzoate-CoA ligase family protein